MTQSTVVNTSDMAVQHSSRASKTTNRKMSVTVESLAHKYPVPNACRIGNLIVSGAIHGVDPATHTMPKDLSAQCAHVFANMKTIVEAAGGSTKDIIKMTVYLRDRENREPLNAEWVRMFPDPETRPARHSQPLLVEGPSLVQCDFMAVIGEPD
ncbi:Enamine deaminase RidA, house cleaning of reactive enamine intermediates, YjgF/YER057c/UK114 family [Rhizobium mongolense subsp. loessense]|uniref:Enamine deaminase RidA, house cleaning of reactive enamine intermediates, YjgF/YER057c/UK114 family n=2 Tax=Rhizobium mongolense TaxID=57676 RepID=A0A1G4S3A3_9HYPH|nr:Enamine deaminase RidA, house cleaning of reactive enamine intermediates, YjgF/YER057c/UK114 family [Rhizobium mongolense subsp. loessense]